MFLLCPAQELVLGTQPEAPVTELIWMTSKRTVWTAETAMRDMEQESHVEGTLHKHGGVDTREPDSHCERFAFAAM